jgi:hypothetical protein
MPTGTRWCDMVFLYELKKIISSSAILGFVVLCLAFNMLSIESVGNVPRESTTPTNVFEGYTTDYIAEAYITTLKLTGSLADAMRDKYTQLQTVALKKAQHGDALGQYTYEQHRVLFERTMFPLLLEGIFLAVLIMLFTLGYENINGTDRIVYCSNIGRRAILIKGAAALVVTLGAYGLITIMTLFRLLHGFEDMLGQNVSSCFNLMGDLIAGTRPFITWASYTVLQYLWAVIGVSAWLLVCFSLAAFIVGVCIKNSYVGFIALFMSAIFCIMLPIVLPNNSYLKYLLINLPIWVCVKLPIWFTDGGMDILWRNFETWGTCASLCALLISASIAKNDFKRRDLL